MNLDDLERQLLASIDQRYRSHASKDLADYIFANYLFQSFDLAYIDFIFAARHDISAYLSDEVRLAKVVDYCIQSTKHYTYQRNQFINYTPPYEGLLQAEYREFILKIKALLEQARSPGTLAQSFTAVLSRHHERLRLILASYCVAYHSEDLEDNPLLQTVPCEEYSARFQLHVLNLDVADLDDPILDIGCGTSGTLVKYLSSQGHVAYGLDRLAPAAPRFFQGDWFDFDYAQHPWGTIVAHHALSTHFIYNHLNNRSVANQYARLFMRILASLKPGGRFCYAPGLPFFEDHVADLQAYALHRTNIAANTLGLGEISYAVAITRLDETTHRDDEVGRLAARQVRRTASRRRSL